MLRLLCHAIKTPRYADLVGCHDRDILCRQGLMMAKQQNLTRAIGTCRALRFKSCEMIIPHATQRQEKPTPQLVDILIAVVHFNAMVGVSNYKVKDLESLNGDVPSVNQCLMSVSLVRRSTIHGSSFSAELTVAWLAAA